MTFEADFLDVYGPIEIHTQEDGVHVLDEEGRFSCERPAFRASGESIAFGALSSRQFWWEDVVSVDEDADCLTIRLDIGNQRSGLLAYHYDGPSACFPFEFRIRHGPGDWQELGQIASWGFDSSRLDGLLFEHQLLLLVSEARAGRIVVAGGGYATTEVLTRVDSGFCKVGLSSAVSNEVGWLLESVKFKF